MTVLCAESIQTLPQALAQKIEEKLQMVDVLCKVLNKEKPCSMHKAAVLTPSILELLSRLNEAGIDPNKTEKMFWDSGVKHIDEINVALPEIIKKWRKITKRKGALYNIQHQLCKRADPAKFQINELRDLKGIEYTECKLLREEALVALLKTREVLKNPGTTVSIVSDNPQLIKIILSLSALWDIKIDNYFGASLQELDEIDFIRLILETVKQQFPPVQLIALLRHKMFAFNTKDFDIQSLIAKLERNYLRGVRKYNSLTELIELISDRQLRIFLWLLQEEFKSFVNLMSQSSAPGHSVLKNLIDLALRLSAPVKNEVCHELVKIKVELDEIDPSAFLKIFDVLFVNEKFMPDSTGQSRVKIYSLLDEAALKSDYVILTGMNEETLFRHRTYDARLIQGVYALLGKSGYDIEFAKIEQTFFALIEKRNLLLTRSSMISGAPQTPSRLLIKLELAANKFQETQFYNTNLLQKARSFYTPSEFIQNVPTAPVPPFENRLKQLSVTQVERLIRDPYSIYVSSILKLKKLDDVDKALDHLEFGKFVHGVIDRFCRNYVTGKDEQAYFKQVMICGQMQAAHMAHFPLVRTIWLTQLKKLASWIVNFEMIKRKKEAKIKIYTEERGEIKFTLAMGNVFTLSCKADRIEIASGGVTIIDFKTGQAPSRQNIFSGISPQLPLEALILQEKGFTNITALKRGKENVVDISYITLSVGMRFGKIISFRENLDSVISEARSGIKNLMTFYNNANTPFLIQPNADYGFAYNEYVHIERIEVL